MKVVIIVSYRRTGSTVLQEQITAHRDVDYLNGEGHNEFHLFEYAHTDRAAYDRLFATYCTNKPTYDIVDDFEAVLATCSTPVVLMKSTRMALRQDTWKMLRLWCEQTNHHAALLALSRFPLDSISSDIARDNQPIVPDRRVLQPMTAQEVWCETYRRILDEHDFGHSFRLLRLEDLVHQPDQEVADLFDWIDVPRPHPKQIGWEPKHWQRWRIDPLFENFQPSDAMIDCARQLGYDVPR